MSRRAKTSSLSRLTKHGSQWVSRLPKSYRDAIAQASLVDSVGATASGLLAWRDALLEGKTPTTGGWPAGALGHPLVEWCEQSGVLPQLAQTELLQFGIRHLQALWRLDFLSIGLR